MNRTVALFALLIAFLSLSAQPFMFRHLEVADGLSNNSVYSIFKDRDGFMWFGTNSGLNRFDGYTFKIYRHLSGDSCSLPNNYVWGIMEEPDNYFWLKTGTGYARFDKAKDTFEPDLKGFMGKLGSKGMPECVYVDSSGYTWISVAGEGFYRYREGEDTKFLSLYVCGLPDAGVTAIGECAGCVLLLYNSGKFVCVNRSEMTLKWVKDDIMDGRSLGAFSLFVDKEGCVWIYSSSGLWVYDTVADRWRTDLAAHWKGQNDIVHAVSQDEEGRIWVGKDYGGIDVFDKRTGGIVRVVNDAGAPRSLSHNTVYCLYADRNGLMWVGTYKKGVSCYGESMFKFNMHELGDITCIEQADEERLWLGTNDEGLLLWNIRTGETEKRYDFSVPVVALLKSGDGRLWIGTFNGGLYCLDKRSGLTGYTSGKDGLLGNSVWTLAETDGRLWIGYLDRGLQYWNLKDNTLETYEGISGLVASLSVSDDNTLAVGMPMEVALVDPRTLEKHTIPDGNTSGRQDVNQVYCDSRGLVWIAMREGLKMYDKKRHSVKDFTDITGSPGEIMAGVTEDHNHDMWISSTRRLIHLKVSKDSKGEYTFESHIYNDKDGLQNCDFNLRAIKTLDNGMVVAGGLYGLNVFDPDGIHYNKVLPKVMFSALYLFNKEIEAGKEYGGHVVLPEDLNVLRKFELDYGQNIFTIELASDNFNLPEKTTYMYRLDGFNDEWLSLPPGMNRLTFTNLASGKYVLNVKAINSDGYEGTEVARLEIFVHPPFWMSWWAYICYVLIFVLALLLARRHLLRREREKFHIRQVEQEAAKNEEINQMKFRFFTNISHELRTPLTLIVAPLEELLAKEKDESRRSMLVLMYRNAQRLLALVNQLLDFRKGEMSGHQLSLSESDIVPYIREVCNSFLLMADEKHIQFSFFSALEYFPMAFDADKIGKVVMNLLSNAFKYTPDGGRVAVMLEHIESEPEMLEIKVSDTGIGIPDADKERIFDRFYQTDHKGMEETTGSGIGLSLVRDFVSLHDGTVEVFDNIGTGTVFVVHLPVRHVDVVAELPKPVVVRPEADGVPEQMVEQTDRDSFPLLLVVDDSEDFRQFMQHSLELQYRVEVASNGEEAWKKIQEKQPDLVISDVMMPVMDGNELCRLIKSDKRTSHIPVILLTARQAVESKVKGLETGADDYVTKPFNMIVLVLRIRKLIELSRYRQVTHATIDPTPSDIVITSLDEKLIEKAVKYVEDNISRSDLSVEELSRELGMSRVHLYKKLLQITGKTPIEFIRVIRLKRAAQLLRESQLHVSEVAYEVGFNSPRYFSRYFKDEFGVQPSVYQEKEGK